MAFNKNNLILTSQHGVPSAPKTWLYVSADTLADINTANYMLLANDVLTVNDMITIVSSTGGTAVHTINIVNAVSSSAVDLSDGLVITATDSD